MNRLYHCHWRPRSRSTRDNRNTQVHSRETASLPPQVIKLSSPVSIQTQSLALRALRKRKPQETQALALASSQSWLPPLRPSIPIGWQLAGTCVCCVKICVSCGFRLRNARDCVWMEIGLYISDCKKVLSDLGSLKFKYLPTPQNVEKMSYLADFKKNEKLIPGLRIQTSLKV